MPIKLYLKFKILEKYRTQADFAQKLGNHESKISRVIQGRQILSDLEKRTWANALNCSPKDIFPSDNQA